MLLQTTFLSCVAPDELFPAALLGRSSYDLHSVDPAELELLRSTKARKKTQVAPNDITPAFVDIHTARRGVRLAYK